MTTEPTGSPPAFDGIICFGCVDWWYHNRGHYDLQILRQFESRVPVLYVNSIGMRVPRPSEGAMFVTRLRRKLGSVFRGLVPVRDGFSVFSPLTIPGGGRSGLAKAISRKALALQVRWAARRAGIRRPLVWVACPPAAPVVPALDPALTVYQRTDRFEAFTGVDPESIAGFDRDLKAMSDLTLYCSRLLHEEETGPDRAGTGARAGASAFVDHGVDFDRFEQAGRQAMAGGDAPDDMSDIPKPRVGFIGGMDAHTFDPPFFLEVAAALSEIQFLMVGASSLPDGWCTLPNVHFLGQKPYEEVADYMAASDVLIMPWNRSEWIRVCNPIKLKEYLATGRPVVSTWFAEVDQYRPHVAVATEPTAFAAAIRSALDDPGDPEARRDRVRSETWARKGETIWSLLTDQGAEKAERR